MYRFPVNYINAPVLGSFLGSKKPFEYGGIVAVEAYPGSVPTFTWQSTSGHIYAYLPPHAFGSNPASPPLLRDRVDIECPDEVPSWCQLGLSNRTGHGKIGIDRHNTKLVSWGQYLVTLDWAQANVMVHIVTGYDPQDYDYPMVIRTSRFQVGGTEWNPPDWKKSRVNWKLPKI